MIKNLGGVYNKYLKIAFINILLILTVVLSIDFFIYTKFKNEYIKETESIEIFPPISYIDNYKDDYSFQSLNFQMSKKNNLDYFRSTSGEEYNDKKPILIFGCSFAYSYGLDDNQTISSKLSTATKRTVYNFGICAAGIQHMLALIKNPNLYNKINQTPEHIIYIYITSHLERLQANIFPQPMMANGVNLQYKLKDNSLILNYKPFYNFSKNFIIKSLYYQSDLKRNNGEQTTKEHNAKLAKQIFIESKKEIEKKYSNVKFTIIRYEVEDDNADTIEIHQMWNDLEKEGFTIIKSSDLIGRKYRFNSQDTNQDHYHPSELAWDLLIPPLVKKLNL